eukprot:6226912-Pyramimonas_sp.AAC.1
MSDASPRTFVVEQSRGAPDKSWNASLWIPRSRSSPTFILQRLQGLRCYWHDMPQLRRHPMGTGHWHSQGSRGIMLPMTPRIRCSRRKMGQPARLAQPTCPGRSVQQGQAAPS